MVMVNTIELAKSYAFAVFNVGVFAKLQYYKIYKGQNI